MAPIKECLASRFAENPFCSYTDLLIFLTTIIFVALMGIMVVYLLYLNHVSRAQTTFRDPSLPQPPYPPLQRSSLPALIPASHETKVDTTSVSPSIWQWTLGSRQFRPLTSAKHLFPERTTSQIPNALSTSIDTNHDSAVLPRFPTQRGRSRTPRRLAISSYGTMDDCRATQIDGASTSPRTSIGHPKQGTIARRRNSPFGVFVMDEEIQERATPPD